MSSALQEPQPAAEPTRDAVFEVLGNDRRRLVIRTLREADGSIELGELAERVAARENDIPVREVSYQQRKRAYTALQQSHLPKMDDAGALHYDSDRGVIEASEGLSEFDVYLEVVPRSGLPRSEFYLGAGVVSVALAAVAWLGLFPVSPVPPLAWGGLFVATFGVAALLHYRATRMLGTERAADSDTDTDPDR
jgi:hypothetical protein